MTEMLGVQAPRIRSVPESAASSRGREAVEIAASAGLMLDPWQELALEDACAIRKDGRWAGFEVGLNVPRQNGKGGVIEARELAGLVEWGERLVIHSAHEFATASEAFLRMEEILAGTPELARKVRSISRAHGQEGFKFRNSARLRYRTRTKGGGRGFSADCLFLDEAMVLQESFIGALLPTQAARSVDGNPQTWYTGSAVDQMVHEHGVVFARLRERGLRGTDPSLVYHEYSPEFLDEHGKPLTLDQLAMQEELLADIEAWRQATPGLGIRISAEHIANELRSMDGRTFATERLCVGDWPATGKTTGLIDIDEWVALSEPRAPRPASVCFAIDASPDRSKATIAAAGFRGDELAQVEIADYRPGTGWVVDRVVELAEQHDPVAVVLDSRGPAASLLHELAEADVEVSTVTGTEYANACGLFYDLIDQARLRHLGQPELNASVRAAAKRDLGEAWAWSRRRSTADASPLIAATLALWGVSTRTQTVYSRRGVVTV